MKVRLSVELRRKVEEAARLNNRTLNAEINSRLEWSFASGEMTLHRMTADSGKNQNLHEGFADLQSELRLLRQQVAEIDKRTEHLLPRRQK